MAEVFITRRERFNAAHRLFRPDLTNEENFNVYGKCSNPNWHGHNYTLFVTVKAQVNPTIGFSMNLKELSTILKNEIIEKIDHKNINVEVDFMQGKIASTENLTIAIWEVIAPLIAEKGATLHCVRVEETENNSAEYYGN